MSEEDDIISVYFADDGKESYLFHSLRFLPQEEPLPQEEATTQPGGGVRTWFAVGDDHPCGRDLYKSFYRFEFMGVHLREFEVRFEVSGPCKDYTSTTNFTRQMV